MYLPFNSWESSNHLIYIYIYIYIFSTVETSRITENRARSCYEKKGGSQTKANPLAAKKAELRWVHACLSRGCR